MTNSRRASRGPV